MMRKMLLPASVLLVIFLFAFADQADAAKKSSIPQVQVYSSGFTRTFKIDTQYRDRGQSSGSYLLTNTRNKTLPLLPSQYRLGNLSFSNGNAKGKLKKILNKRISIMPLLKTLFYGSCGGADFARDAKCVLFDNRLVNTPSSPASAISNNPLSLKNKRSSARFAKRRITSFRQCTESDPSQCSPVNKLLPEDPGFIGGGAGSIRPLEDVTAYHVRVWREEPLSGKFQLIFARQAEAFGDDCRNSGEWWLGCSRNTKATFTENGRIAGPIGAAPGSWTGRCRTNVRTRVNSTKKDNIFHSKRVLVTNKKGKKVKKLVRNYFDVTKKAIRTPVVPQKDGKAQEQYGTQKQNSGGCYWESSDLGGESLNWSQSQGFNDTIFKKTRFKANIEARRRNPDAKLLKREFGEQRKWRKNRGGLAGKGFREAVGLRWKFENNGPANPPYIKVNVHAAPGVIYVVQVAATNSNNKLIPFQTHNGTNIKRIDARAYKTTEQAFDVFYNPVECKYGCPQPGIDGGSSPEPAGNATTQPSPLNVELKSPSATSVQEPSIHTATLEPPPALDSRQAIYPKTLSFWHLTPQTEFSTGPSAYSNYAQYRGADQSSLVAFSDFGGKVLPGVNPKTVYIKRLREDSIELGSDGFELADEQATSIGITWLRPTLKNPCSPLKRDYDILKPWPQKRKECSSFNAWDDAIVARATWDATWLGPEAGQTEVESSWVNNQPLRCPVATGQEGVSTDEGSGKCNIDDETVEPWMSGIEEPVGSVKLAATEEDREEGMALRVDFQQKEGEDTSSGTLGLKQDGEWVKPMQSEEAMLNNVLQKEQNSMDGTTTTDSEAGARTARKGDVALNYCLQGRPDGSNIFNSGEDIYNKDKKRTYYYSDNDLRPQKITVKKWNKKHTKRFKKTYFPGEELGYPSAIPQEASFNCAGYAVEYKWPVMNGQDDNNASTFKGLNNKTYDCDKLDRTEPSPKRLRIPSYKSRGIDDLDDKYGRYKDFVNEDVQAVPFAGSAEALPGGSKQGRSSRACGWFRRVVADIDAQDSSGHQRYAEKCWYNSKWDLVQRGNRRPDDGDWQLFGKGEKRDCWIKWKKRYYFRNDPPSPPPADASDVEKTSYDQQLLAREQRFAARGLTLNGRPKDFNCCRLRTLYMPYLSGEWGITASSQNTLDSFSSGFGTANVHPEWLDTRIDAQGGQGSPLNEWDVVFQPNGLESIAPWQMNASYEGYPDLALTHAAKSTDYTQDVNYIRVLGARGSG